MALQDKPCGETVESFAAKTVRQGARLPDVFCEHLRHAGTNQVDGQESGRGCFQGAFWYPGVEEYLSKLSVLHLNQETGLRF